jgi:nitrate reductase NapD
VHAASPDGRLVVTLEAPSAREIAGRMEDIQRLDAVLSALLVYQHNETLEAMMEEVPHEAH